MSPAHLSTHFSPPQLYSPSQGFQVRVQCSQLPQTLSQGIYLTTPPSVLFFWEGNKTKPWGDVANGESLSPGILPVYSICQEQISCLSPS